MRLGHPFERIPAGRLRLWAVPLAGLALAILATFPWVLPNRETDTLIDLVEAGSPQAAAGVLARWSEEDRLRASFGVGLDFLFNPAYASFAALACIWASRVFRGAVARAMGVVLAWGAWGCIATNVVENVAIFRMLLGRFDSPWPELARLAHFYAGIVLLGGAVPYAAVACIVRATGRRRAMAGAG